MRLPIQYALTYPDRWVSGATRLDWRESRVLEFEAPDEDRFPALRLGHEVARVGGTAGAVVSGANERAVQAFLAGQLPFDKIVAVCQAVLGHHDFDPSPSLADLLRLDAWARQEVMRWIQA
jgi:1-deoxy-D-xylulose-5-phosphate reductoisomerase